MARPRRLVFLALLIGSDHVGVPWQGAEQRRQHASGSKPGEWRAYGAVEGSTRYSAARSDHAREREEPPGRLDLEVRQLRTATETLNTETTPLMVNGVLYFTAGPRRNVVAANAGTGETLWVWRPDEGERFDQSATQGAPRRGLLDRRQGRADRRRHAGLSARRRSTPRPAYPFPTSARTASSICSSSSIWTDRWIPSAGSATARRR